MTDDPYVRRTKDVLDPPSSLREQIRFLGPGMIVVASIVGSGELITTTALGANVGFTCLWLLLLSCLSKTMLMEELGRFAISSGETSLQGFNKLPGPRWRQSRGGHFGWFIYLWIASALPGVITGAGIIGGVGQVMNIAFPVMGLVGLAGDKVWTVIMFIVTMTLILSGRYHVIQALCTAMVLSFTFATIVCAVALQWTQYAISWSDIVDGLKFKLPAGSMLLALGAYGGTGATPGESMAYTYWCLEKGWSRFVGTPDGTDAWTKRARGWLRIMQFDVINVMVIFTLATIAFYFLGAAVLKPMIASGGIKLEPNATSIDGPTTMASLSNMYTQTLGPWAKWLFLAGGFCVLYSTVISGWSSGGRFWADMLGIVGIIDPADYRKRLLFIRIFSFVLPLITTVSYLFIGRVVILLAIAGTIGTLITPIVALGTLYLRHRRIDRRVAPTRLGDYILGISVALMVIFTPFALWQAWQSLR